MTNFQAFQIVAHNTLLDRLYLEALCVLIHSGYLYTMPGAFGRLAQLCIDSELIHETPAGWEVNETALDSQYWGEVSCN